MTMQADEVVEQPLSRVALKRLRTQQEILDVAQQILAGQGVDGLTLVAVADRLGYTKPALYHYFHSKEDLLRSLILQLIQQESLELTAAVMKSSGRSSVLGTLIRAFYQRYRGRLNEFRLVYSQFQLMDWQTLGLTQNMIRQDINPLTHHLFDEVVAMLSNKGELSTTPEMRQLAFSAWLAAVGLMDMISIAAIGQDPLRHSDDALLRQMEQVFNAAAERLAVAEEEQGSAK